MSDQQVCYHCKGELTEDILYDQKHFCCEGCKTVYEIISANSFEDYYALKEDSKGQNKSITKDYSFLDNEQVQKAIFLFKEANYAKLEFYIPSIHCAACVWLLENLVQLNPGIRASKVDFPKRKLRVDIDLDQISLKELVTLIAQLGYEPNLSLEDLEGKSKPKLNRSDIFRIGVAGFCFGNVMLLSFPEYLGQDWHHEKFAAFFAGLNLVLALPVLLYAAFPYYQSAWNGLKSKQLNLDVPIVIGILVLFIRSAYEILTGNGMGYIDSLTGFVFFLQIGKFYQKRTYDHLNFERDFKSFFPISVLKYENGEYSSFPVSDITVGDQLKLRNGEIIPMDAKLLNEKAHLDYSFITGESRWIPKEKGTSIFAGGKIVGEAIEVIVEKPINQGYLTDLWNNETFVKTNKGSDLLALVSRHFTLGLLLLSTLSFLVWYQIDPSRSFEIVTSVLIVACPCALALASPFTLGNAMHLLNKKGVYLKHLYVLEDIPGIQHLVFDKTGTLTSNQVEIHFSNELSKEEQAILSALSGQSNHPKSQALYQNLPKSNLKLTDFIEHAGKGVEGKYEGVTYRLGRVVDSKEDVFMKADQKLTAIQYNHPLKANVSTLLNDLKKEYEVSLLSGDNDESKKDFESLINISNLNYNQKPQDKLDFVESLQINGQEVMMVGDGLNDAGALKQSDVGVIVVNDQNAFNPACDIIINEEGFKTFDAFIHFSKQSVRWLKWAFVLSIAYNLTGLTFAMSGQLTPLVSAILMPLSSITVVLFGVLGTRWLFHRNFS